MKTRESALSSDNPRLAIVCAFSEWTAYCVARSGWPPAVSKDRGTVYALIRTPDYDGLVTRDDVSRDEFNQWHEQNTHLVLREQPHLPLGWAVKLINMYLKTRVYLAGDGCPQLSDHIHPPLDSYLWNGIKAKYWDIPEIFRKTHILCKIKDIKDYATYRTIIQGCELIALRRGHRLIEVDELWGGTAF